MSDAQIDPQQPWLGLNSFTESTRELFCGREDEVTELARRVQRKPLTILFGQSGLGKTSIVRAGLVPRLREQDFCPVYVRLDYAPGTPSPADQIKQAILREAASAGGWSRAGVAAEGESLWEFLHHRDDRLLSHDGRELTPLLIFDQFEEIFTLAQANDFGRTRAAEIVGELADLAENRAPRALEERLESDDALAERFDFARCDYRILIVLREDYLAHLETLKGSMPSVTQNRMRIARMTGQQALQAVIKPGGRLVSQEVAEAIVRFVAGGMELRNAEVEPSLLSLICRELNAARIAHGKNEISTDLLAGSHAGILATFYERALLDQPPGVHRFIEEELLTELGFRENVAEERVRKAFAEAGAAKDALAQLVDRRLLRIEERLDIRRVELTHDVLCEVVRSARQSRHAREAQEAAERALAQQQEREVAGRRALRRARVVAAACAGLAAISVGAAAFGVWGMREAQRTHALAEAARGESERLIVYLLDDFYRELEPIGRSDIVGELGKRALDYYKALPQPLQTPNTARNRALAEVRYGAALRNQGQLGEAAPLLDHAIKTLSSMRAGGDASEPTAIGLALGYAAQARVADSSGRTEAASGPSLAAVAVLDPLARAPHASVALRRAWGAALTQLGYVQLRQLKWTDADRTLEAARGAWKSVDGLKEDADAGANYAIATAWLVETLGQLGRDRPAREVAAQGRDAASAVIERNPTHMLALRGRALISLALANIEDRQMRLVRSKALSDASAQDWALLTRIDPANFINWNNWTSARIGTVRALWDMGQLREAAGQLAKLRAEGAPHVGRSAMLAGQAGYLAFWHAALLSQQGDFSRAEAVFKDHVRWHTIVRSALREGSFARQSEHCVQLERRALLSRAQMNWAATREQSPAVLACVDKLRPSNQLERQALIELRRSADVNLALASLSLGEPRQAEQSLRASLEAAKGVPQDALDEQQRTVKEQLWLALALARQGRREEARAVIGPVVAFQRKMRAMPESADVFERAYLAAALAVAAASEAPGTRRDGLLNQARSEYNAVGEQARGTNTVKWIGRLLEPERG